MDFFVKQYKVLISDFYREVQGYKYSYFPSAVQLVSLCKHLHAQ